MTDAESRALRILHENFPDWAIRPPSAYRKWLAVLVDETRPDEPTYFAEAWTGEELSAHMAAVQARLAVAPQPG